MKARKILKLRLAQARSKEAPRTPNGRVRQEDPMKTVKAQPHRRWLPKGDRDNRHADDAFGLLLLSKQISRPQYEAGVAWLEAWLAFARIKGIPIGRIKGTLASTLDERIKGQDNADISSSAAAKIAEEFERLSSRPLASLGPGAPEARDALVNTIVHGQMPDQWRLGVLREALNAIGKGSGHNER